MRIGIGLPNTVPGTNGSLILDWARRAEERGFAFVSTIGRIGYPSYDPLTTLAPPGDPVPLLIGGHSERAVRRTVRWGAGWTGAGGGPERAEPMVGKVLA